jgi:hypothetical protein
MFGFRNRKRFNGKVDEKLNKEYRISTQQNPKFPGVIAYLGMIDEAWNAKFTEEEAAMFIATLYYSGLKREGHDTEARELAKTLASTGQAEFGAGRIGMQRLATFMAHIERANAET